jgi:hypothetical protein
MIPDQDYYADEDGKITTDPEKYARQIAVKGVELDERIAKRYGIRDTLVSTDEPHASRRVTGRNESSVHIEKASDNEASANVADQPETDEPDTTESKAAASRKTAAKEEGAKKK